MGDSISREAAIGEIRKCRLVVDAIEKIRRLPSAQPELIRCKDCEYWYPEEDDEYGHCRKHDFWTSGSWYCADPERREDETDLDVCVSGGCDIIND